MLISTTIRRAVARRLGLLALNVLLATAAYGQRIVTDPDGESCQVTPDCKPHKYEFQPGPGQTFLHWQVRGDARLLSPNTQNPAEICSDGYGKARITAHYFTFSKGKGECREQCPDSVYHTLDYDLFKQFTSPDPIHGPTCVTPSQEATFWVPPILTDWPHRSAGIGTDAYFWSGFPAGAIVKMSGDSSAITLVVPAGTPDFSLTCQIGRCNKPIEFPIQVGVDIPIITGGPTCFPVVGAGVFNLTVQARAHSTYRWLVPAGWQVTPAIATMGITPLTSGPMIIQVNPGRSSGDVVVVASSPGGGRTQVSETYHLDRRLVPYTGGALPSANYNVLSGCLPATAPYNTTVSLSNAPINTSLIWTLPATWTVSSTTAHPATRIGTTQEWTTTGGAIVVVPPDAAGGLVQVRAQNCPAGVVQRFLSTSGEHGCDAMTYTGIEPGTNSSTNHRYTLTTLPGWLPCTPTGGDTRYTWEINDGSGWVLAPSGIQGRNPTIVPIYVEPTATPLPAGTNIRVSVASPESCLNTMYTRPTPLPRPTRREQGSHTPAVYQRVAP